MSLTELQYEEFIDRKNFILQSVGFEVDKSTLNPNLFDFQRDIVRWALAKGRACVFADCGLGKTIIQLEWANQIYQHTGRNVLIVAPLSVCEQTRSEGEKFGINVTVCESQKDVNPGINITNYEKLDKFVSKEFVGVVLDESSILKSFTGKVRNQIINMFGMTEYRLACTATPAPNDYMELGNHSEFLGVMTRGEMLSMHFVHDGGQTSKWRLKGHAENSFRQWMASWAVFIDNPTNLGYSDEGYTLPELRIHQIIVDGDEPITEKLSLTQRRGARKASLPDRCKAAADLVKTDEQWLMWCNLNAESSKLHELIDGSKEVCGSDKNQYKAETMKEFSNGELQVLVTKPKIAGFGMNWQNCHKMAFVGLSDSYEQFYQALRRCWRFGQTEPVDAYIIISAKEGAVLENIERKKADAEKMQKAMIDLTKEITKKELRKTVKMTCPYEANVDMKLPEWIYDENS